MRVNSKNRGFVEGTLVLMADGKQKPIEQIQTGDYVLSFNEFDADAPLEAMPVTNTFSRIDNNILEVKVGEETLLVAENQMFMGPHNDWKEVYSHSLVVDVDGNPIEYTVNKVKKGKHKVYDITVDENHSLIANGIRVHNQGVDSSVRSGGPAGRDKSTDAVGRSGTGPQKSPNTKTSNTKGTNTTKGPNSQNTNGGGAAKSQSSRGSQEGAREGGGNRDVNGSSGNGQNAAYRKSNNQKPPVATKKKSKAKELDPVKPNGLAVGTKLIETIEDTVDVLQELIVSFTPAQLTTTKVSIQAGVDVIYSFANEYVAALYASEMKVYDKVELIQSANTIMLNAAELKKLFEETTISSQSKSVSLLLLSIMEAEVTRMRNKLTVYTTTDTKGELTVTVNNKTNTKKKVAKKVKKVNGKWQYN